MGQRLTHKPVKPKVRCFYIVVSTWLWVPVGMAGLPIDRAPRSPAVVVRPSETERQYDPAGKLRYQRDSGRSAQVLPRPGGRLEPGARWVN